jgi:succinate dehydrogenase/fumarate reductase cytochrome b subunit
MSQTTSSGEVINQRTYEAVSHGFVAWIVQRVSSIALLIFLPLKVWSGWAFTGRAPGGAWVVGLHTAAWVDLILLTALAFHALYGLRAILIESGLARYGRGLFTAATAGAIILTALSAYTTLWGV